MQMAVQAAAFTPLCDDSKVGLSHEAHEQQDVDVAGLPVENRNGETYKFHYLIRSQKVTVTTLLRVKLKCYNNVNWC